MFKHLFFDNQVIFGVRIKNQRYVIICKKRLKRSYG